MIVVVGDDRTASGRTLASERAAAQLAGWAPVSVSEAAAACARELVARAEPGTSARCKALLFAAGRLAGFGESLGLELSAAVLLDSSTVERFVVEGCAGVSPATRRTLRTNLRSLGRAIERYPVPVPVALARERAKLPYSPADIDGFLALAAAQSTRARRMCCSALICLGAGAGVIAGELRHVRGTDVVCRAGGLLVTVQGRRARSVPVLERYHQRLLEAAAFAGERYMIGGRDPDRRNVTDTLTAALSSDLGLPRLQAGRLRSSWLVACAEAIGLRAFMHAAGITCSQRLGDLAAQLPDPSDSELVRLLGGNA